jgi:hypothetical protein
MTVFPPSPLDELLRRRLAHARQGWGGFHTEQKDHESLVLTLSGHDVLCDSPRLRYKLTVLPHAGEVKTHRFTNQIGGVGEGRAGRDTTRKVWNVSTVPRVRLFEKNGVFHLNPACLGILLFVPGSRSFERCPAMVTRPLLDRMLVLAMAALLNHHAPSIRLHQLDCIAYFHSDSAAPCAVDAGPLSLYSAAPSLG